MKINLTGRQRLRLWKSKLILQIEYEYYDRKLIDGQISGEFRKAWKDAEVQDLSWKIEGKKEAS